MGERHKVHLGRPCDICGDVGEIKKLVICNLCKENTEHIYCMQTKLDAVPDEWFCEVCCSNYRAFLPKNGIYASDRPKAPLLSHINRLSHHRADSKPLAPSKILHKETLPLAGANKLHQNLKMQTSFGNQRFVENGSLVDAKIQTSIQRCPPMKSSERTELSDDNNMKLIGLRKPLCTGGKLFNKMPNAGKKVDFPVTDSPSFGNQRVVENGSLEDAKIQTSIQRCPPMKSCERTELSDDDNMKLIGLRKPLCVGGKLFNKMSNTGKKVDFPVRDSPSFGNQRIVENGSLEVAKIQTSIQRCPPMKSCEKTELSDVDNMKLIGLRKPLCAGGNLFNKMPNTGKKADFPVTDSPSSKPIPLSRDGSFRMVETMKVKFLATKDAFSLASGAKAKQSGTHGVSDPIPSFSVRASADVCPGGSVNSGSNIFLQKGTVNSSSQSGHPKLVDEIPAFLPSRESEGTTNLNRKNDRLVIKLLRVKEESEDATLSAGKETGNFNTETEKWVDKAASQLLQIKEEITDVLVSVGKIGNLNTDKGKSVFEALNPIAAYAGDIFPIDAEVKNSDASQKDLQLLQVKEEITDAPVSVGKTGNLNTGQGKPVFEALNPIAACAGDIFPIVSQVKNSDASQKDLRLKTSEVSAKMLPNIPVPNALWKGSLEIIDMVHHSHLYDGLQAHLPSRVSPKAREISEKLPENIRFDLVPRHDVWPKPFLKHPPTDEDIALYILPGELDRSKKKYLRLLNLIVEGDFAMINVFEGAELLIFTSKQISVDYQGLNMDMYLWGVFRSAKRKKVNVPSSGISQNSVYNGDGDNCEVMEMEIDMVGGINVGKMDKVVPRPNTVVTVSGPLRSKLEDLSVAVSAGLIIQDTAEPMFPPGFSQPMPDIPPGFFQPMSDIPPSFSEPTVDMSPGFQKLHNLKHYEVSDRGYRSHPGVDSVRRNPKLMSEIEENKSTSLANLTSLPQKKDADKGIARESVKTEGKSLRNFEMERNRFLGLPRSGSLIERSEDHRHYNRSHSHSKRVRDKVAEEIERTEESYKEMEKRRKRCESEKQNKSHRYGGSTRHYYESQSHSRRGTDIVDDEEIDKVKDGSVKMEQWWKGEESSRAGFDNQRNHTWSHSSRKRSIDREVPGEIQKSEASLRKMEQEKRLFGTSRYDYFRERSQNLRNHFERQSNIDGDVAKEAVRRTEESLRKLEQKGILGTPRPGSSRDGESQKDHSGSQPYILTQAPKGIVKNIEESNGKAEVNFCKMGPRPGSEKTVEKFSKMALERNKYLDTDETDKDCFRGKEMRLLDVPNHETFNEIYQSQCPGSESLSSVQTETDRDVLEEAALKTEESRSKTEHGRKKLQDTLKHGSFSGSSWNPLACSENQSHILTVSDKVVAKDSEKMEASYRKTELETKKFFDTTGSESFSWRSWNRKTCVESQSHILTGSDKVVAKDNEKMRATSGKTEQEKRSLDTLKPESFSESLTPRTHSESQSHIMIDAEEGVAKATERTEGSSRITEQEKKFLDNTGPESCTASSSPRTFAESQSHIMTSAGKVVAKDAEETEACSTKTEQKKFQSFTGTSHSLGPHSQSLVDISGRDGLKETAKLAEEKNLRNSHQSPRQAILPARGIRYLQLFPMEAESMAPEVDAKNLDFNLELGIGLPAPTKISLKWDSPSLGLSTHRLLKDGKDRAAIVEEQVQNDGFGDEVMLSL